MQIRCEKCKTEYALDEKLLSPKGTPVRCTQCGCVFKAYPQSTGSENAPAGGSPSVKWTLKKKSGVVEKFRDTPRLQMFISDGNAQGEDAVSKYGGPWKAIADVPELQSFLSTSRPSVRPRGQGVTAQAKNSIRQPTMAGAAARVSDPASAKNPINIRSIPSQRNTEPPPSLSGSTKNKQPKTASSTRESLSSAGRKSIEFGRTLISNAPPPSPEAEAKKESQSDALTAAPQAMDNLAAGNTIRSNVAQGKTIRAHSESPAASTLPDNKSVDSSSAPQGSSREPLAGDTLLAGPSAAPPRSAAPPLQDIPDQFQASHSEEPDFSQVPAVKDDQWSQGEQGVDDVEPDWTNAPSTMNPISNESDDELEGPRKSKSTLIWGIVILLVLGSAAGYLYLFERELLISQFGEVQDSKKEERQNTLLIEAREKFLLDTLTDFAQAEKKYLQVLAIDQNNPTALAALSQMYAVWAQYLLDAHLDALSDAGEEDSGTTKADQLEKEFETKLGEAKRRKNQALKIAPQLSQAHIAAAEIELLQGNVAAAKQHLAKGRSEDTLQGASYIGAQIGLYENQNKTEIIGMLKSINVAEPLLRVLYRLARIQAADGKTEDALASIKQILNLNKKHTAALALEKRISTNATIQLLPSEWIAAEDADSDSAEESDTNTASKRSAAGKATSVAGTPTTADAENGDEEMSIDRLLQKASVAQKRGRTQEAADLFNRVLRETPSNVDALNGLGYTYLEQGNNGQAISKFKRALGISSQFGPSIIGMAQAYKSMGQKKEAVKWYEKYLAAFPSGRDAGMAQRNVNTLRIDIENDASEDDAPPPPITDSSEAKIAPPAAATPTPPPTIEAPTPPVVPAPPATTEPPVEPTSPSVETP